MIEGRNVRGTSATPTPTAPEPGIRGTISAMTTLAERDANQAAAYRVGAMLMSIGTVHFLAPTPFDTIVPAELPGSARFYTYASGVAEIAVGGATPATTHAAVGRAGGRPAVPRRLPGQYQHGPAVVGQALADAHRRDRPAAAADPDDHHGAEDQARELTCRVTLAPAVSAGGDVRCARLIATIALGRRGFDGRRGIVAMRRANRVPTETETAVTDVAIATQSPRRGQDARA